MNISSPSAGQRDSEEEFKDPLVDFFSKYAEAQQTIDQLTADLERERKQHQITAQWAGERIKELEMQFKKMPR